MKILHMISGGDSGGAKTHLFTLIDELKKYIDCEVVCLIPGVFYKEILKKDIKTTLFQQRNRFDLSVVKKIQKLIEEEQISVLHVHGALANFVAQFLKKKISIPIVTTMHSDYLLDFDTFFKKIIFTTLNVLALKKIDYVIAVSDNFKKMLIERKFRPNSIYTVYNGMEFSNVPKSVTSREDFAEKHRIKLEEDVIYIGIAARFDVVKGVDVFIEGAAKLYKTKKNVRFVIAGDGELSHQLKVLARDLGIGDVTYFIGFIKDIYGFFNFIDINCLTSLCESFPYSMLEGAAMKKPMVASNVGGISSLVKNGETGYLFEPSDTDDFARCLYILCDRPWHIKEMGENIYNLATTKFSAQTFARMHVDIYKSILRDFNDEKKYDFLISGYYGYKNSGDDALLLAMTNELKRRQFDVRIAVLSANPRETQKTYKVDAFYRFNPLKLFKSIKKSNVLLSGGGSLIQDETSSKSLWYYAYILKCAKKYGLKVMQIANGIGPVNKEKNRRFASGVINSCVDVITLREENSLKELENMNINTTTIITSDPAMILEGSPKSEIKSVFEKEKIPFDKYVCISVRNWKKNPYDFETKIAKIADYIYDIYNLQVVFVPMQYPVDVSISERIRKNMKNPSYIIKRRTGIEDMIGIIREAEMVIAMRLHTLIYGMSMNTPVVAIKYDPKVESFMDYFTQRHCVDIEKLDVNALKKYVDECLNIDNDEETKMICRKMKEKAYINIDIALELLSEEVESGNE